MQSEVYRENVQSTSPHRSLQRYRALQVHEQRVEAGWHIGQHYQLGEYQTHYIYTYPSLQRVLGIVLLGITFALAVIFLLLSPLLPHLFGPLTPFSLPDMVFLGLLLVGILLIVTAPPKESDVIYLYAEGVAKLISGAEAPRSMRWDEVEELKREETAVLGRDGVNRSHVTGYKIHSRDGHSIFVTPGFQNAGELYDRLEQAVTRHLLSRALLLYHAGHEITFGDLGISQHGIHDYFRHRTLSWDDLSSITFPSADGFTLTIWKREKLLPWAALAKSKVPNLPTLRALVRAIQNRTSEEDACSFQDKNWFV